MSSNFIQSINPTGIQTPRRTEPHKGVSVDLETEPDRFVKNKNPDESTTVSTLMDKNKFLEAGRQILDKVINFVSNSLGIPVFFLGSIKGFTENILHKTFELVQKGFEFIKNFLTEIPGMIMNFVNQNIFGQQNQDTGSSSQK